MFRAINAHLQEDTFYTCCIWYCHSLRELMVASRYTACSSYSSCVLTGHHEISQRVAVPYATCIQCILLKMSIYGSKPVEEYFINK